MGRVKKKPVLALLCVVLSILTIVAMMPGMVYAEENTVGESTTEDNATIKIQEPPVDPSTTATNNVKKVVSNDNEIGTGISYETFLSSKKVRISAEDAKNNKKLGDVSDDFKKFGDIGQNPCSDFVMKGDMSIKDQDGTYDTTNKSAHAVEKDSTNDIQANLNVSAVQSSIDGLDEIISKNLWWITKPDDAYVNNLETGFCATFSISDNLDGDFYVPNDLEDAKAHYKLSFGDNKPLIYRINYASSTFTKKKVSIVMDLDLTQMTPFKNTYSGDHGGKLPQDAEDKGDQL